MAKSKAKKMRDKMTREGKRNPELNRSLFVFADMETRKTKTKKEKLLSPTSISRNSNQYHLIDNSIKKRKEFQVQY